MRTYGRRVVITGQGAITPVGLSVEEFWDSLLAGRSGVGPIQSFDTEGLPVTIAGEVKGFDPVDYMPRTVSRRIDKYAQFAVAAAMQAVENAKFLVDDANTHRVGILIGSGYGPTALVQSGTLTLDSRGHRALAPWLSAATSIDCAAGEVALRLGATGPSGAVSTACASGTSAVGEALRMIQRGDVDAMIAGGADNSITSFDIGSTAMSRALSRRNDDPQRASRPFDKDRDGFVMAAGAGALVLEDARSAERRGAPILAEVVGYGATSDAYHPTAPHPEGLGARRAMQLALDDAGVAASAVDHINAHATSTVLNDRTEAAAIRKVFGDHAPRIPITGVKSMTGHMIGAAGAVELIATVQTLLTGIVPPTINCDDPEDPGLDFVPHRPRQHDVKVAMSNSFGFAGHNATLVVRRYEH
ncbi:MAG: beta-ketoacyl-ACP synthase II [Nonomuraea sp.]|nr:beta-ketoacyl-ACP synthase II [Nonomuraea sp.]NUP65517.1 beta-ketoacyl-ACP synthase II [Nonomuraea sp.]NUP81136.1 beta-ketoacyl-ACP synthase II [Nonomuraea sp.]NUS06790.1 beta-ketoacyl-ACP synthase II [Nonomuraea sp.]NUT42368.1 beta-ketoacyl-ACP synthase II [Thermoactinospora sp.]